MGEMCEFGRNIVQERIRPPFDRITEGWRKQGLLPEGDLQLCNSFIRRYLPQERRSLNLHKDSDSNVTVNVLLNDPSEFIGGLQVYPEASENKGRRNMGRQAKPDVKLGSGAFHRSDLFHGVQMKRGQRYSWILWFKPKCDERD